MLLRLVSIVFCLSLGLPPCFQPYRREMVASKKGRGLMDIDNSVVIVGEVRGVRGLNGNGKKMITNKINGSLDAI